MFKCKVNTCSISGCNYTWTRCHHREGRQGNSGYCGSDVPLLTCVLGLICSQDAKWNENGVLWEINILIIMTYIMTNYEWSKGTLLNTKILFGSLGYGAVGFDELLKLEPFIVTWILCEDGHSKMLCTIPELILHALVDIQCH